MYKAGYYKQFSNEKSGFFEYCVMCVFSSAVLCAYFRVLYYARVFEYCIMCVFSSTVLCAYFRVLYYVRIFEYCILRVFSSTVY